MHATSQHPGDPEKPRRQPVPPGHADVTQFTQAYALVAPSLYAWARLRMTRQLERHLTAEDLVQDIWCRAWSRLHSYQASSSFRAWVIGIARFVLVEKYRWLQAGARVDHGPLGGGPDPTSIPAEATSISRKVARAESLARLIRRVESLSESERKLFLLRALEDRPFPEVARRMGLSLATAQKRWQRLRQALGDDAQALGVSHL